MGELKTKQDHQPATDTASAKEEFISSMTNNWIISGRRKSRAYFSSDTRPAL